MIKLGGVVEAGREHWQGTAPVLLRPQHHDGIRYLGRVATRTLPDPENCSRPEREGPDGDDRGYSFKPLHFAATLPFRVVRGGGDADRSGSKRNLLMSGA